MKEHLDEIEVLILSSLDWICDCRNAADLLGLKSLTNILNMCEEDLTKALKSKDRAIKEML